MMRNRWMNRAVSGWIGVLLVFALAWHPVLAAAEETDAEEEVASLIEEVVDAAVIAEEITVPDETPVEDANPEGAAVSQAQCAAGSRLSEADRALYEQLVKAYEKVNSYSFQGDLTMNEGTEQAMVMKLKGDVRLKPEMAQHLYTTMQMAGMSLEQEMITVNGNMYVKSPAAGWMTVNAPSTSGFDENVSKIFNCDILSLVQELSVKATGDQIELDIVFDSQQWDEQILKTPLSSQTVSWKQHMVIDAATHLPVSVAMNMELNQEGQKVDMKAEYTYAYDKEIQPIAPPPGVE